VSKVSFIVRGGAIDLPELIPVEFREATRSEENF
jgi:hypothetical protein